MKRVGIMGGTFSPIHLGHLILAEQARETYQLDKILFVPTGQPYMKEQVLSSKIRVSMTGLAIEDHPDFTLSTIEADRDGNTYSYETIATLKEQNPDTEYYFIVGADSLFLMEKWMCPERIFGECIVLAAIREGHTKEQLIDQVDYLTQKFHANIKFLSMRQIDISSTEIRNRVKNHLSIRYLVPLKVMEFIHTNHLYEE